MYRSLLRSSIPVVPRTIVWHHQCLSIQSTFHSGGRERGQWIVKNARIRVTQQGPLIVDTVQAQPRRKNHSVSKAFEAGNSCSSADFDKNLYWRRIKAWENVSEAEFMSHRWQVTSRLDKRPKAPTNREEFLLDVEEGMKLAPMAVRLTPHILSVADWSNPIDDPIRKQFVPLASTIVEDHPQLSLDSLHETDDSPVPGLVHRYPEKVLFLVYCRYCTRSYAVGGNTDSVLKTPMKPSKRRWETVFDHIENTPAIQDVVVSGGDSYHLSADHLRLIGDRLLSIPHIKRFRFATKGLAVNPIRILDDRDGWVAAFVEISDKGRVLGKQVAMHTHFNHPHECTWITELAARYLFKRGVVVRNQIVLLRGVNDDVATMSTLIRKLADMNIQPYYVYQSDMVQGVEDLRTPLSTILELEKQIRGTIAGFMTPSFVVDLPGGGGKRLANSFETYDRASGVSTWKAPGVTGEKVFRYYDPIERRL
ncbi:hypothetical protein LTR94_002923 [Friedmanniomyces endolithicus]|nr:hypothetical protein LTR94_002923 [Friedmanniomyces endolithicus]